MTNAEYFLKDNVSIDEIAKEFQNFVLEHSNIEPHTYENEMKEFLRAECKPTLTEDERVILRNIDKKYSIIYRDSLGRLEVKSIEIENTIWKISMVGFNRLFQFIKERRRI